MDAAATRTRLTRLVFWHRRSVAAVLVGLAVLAGVSAVRTDPPGETVVVAARDLLSGTRLAAGDLRTTTIAVRPASSWTSTADVVGRRLAAPVREGEPLTDRRVAGPALLAGYGDDLTLASVAVSSTGVADSVRVGDRVDVVASDPQGERGSRVVARRAPVVLLTDDEDDGLVVGVAVDEETALVLASSSLTARLSLLVGA